jgi:hypothetical protein
MDFPSRAAEEAAVSGNWVEGYARTDKRQYANRCTPRTAKAALHRVLPFFTGST